MAVVRQPHSLNSWPRRYLVGGTELVQQDRRGTVPLGLCAPEFMQQMGEEWKGHWAGMALSAWGLSEHHFPQPQNTRKRLHLPNC